MSGTARPHIAGLAEDLAAEGQELDALLTGDVDLGAPTPADGWSVRDSVVHLHRSDVAALTAVNEPGRWLELLEPLAMAVLMPAWPGTDSELLTSWRATRDRLCAAVLALTEGARIPWFGLSMGAQSFLTARLMETWAHGQDIADAYGAVRPATARLRHIADLGVRTRGWSYAVRGLAAPTAPVRVSLTPPSGDGPDWEWGPDADACADVISGPALDFCLLVTQRRHLADLALKVTGPAAEEWAGIAQAFAGGPTDGRAALG